MAVTVAKSLIVSVTLMVEGQLDSVRALGDTDFPSKVCYSHLTSVSSLLSLKSEVHF
jgi:hypothetical protein